MSYRLDWVFVKAGSAAAGVGLFQPRDPHNLSHFNEFGTVHLSDHNPITVELEQSSSSTGTK